MHFHLTPVTQPLVPVLALGLPFTTQVQQSNRAQAAQRVIQMLFSGDSAAVYTQLSTLITAQLTEDQFAAAMAGIQQQFGAFQEMTEVHEDAASNLVVVTVQFKTMALDAQISFDAEGRIAGLNFVPSASGAAAPTPTYADTSTFSEQDVTVSDFNLPGIFARPKTNILVPAVVLISGSGPNDRDETIGPNKPFRDIAWALASMGIASLRYDKRTKAAVQSLDLLTITVQQEYVDDALAAIQQLRTTEGIDPKRVFLLGHSEGGLVAPRIAAAAGNNLAGVIYAAACATSLQEAIRRQTGYLAEHNPGLSDTQKQAAIEQGRAIAEQINALTPDSPKDQMVFHAPPSYWLDLNAYDPLQTAQALDLPMLFVQGGRDYQVTVSDDLALWQASLGNRPNVAFKVYANLNHLFESGTGLSLPAEYQQPGNVAFEVIDDIAAWIKAQ